MAELRTWVLAKLAWDLYIDWQELIVKFVNGYYCSAGKHILAYLNTIHDAIEATVDWLTPQMRKIRDELKKM